MDLPAPIDCIEWVFGYGSLIWDPGFDYEERAIACLRGYHRRFCIESTRYRGTQQQPGIVLGLAPGGSVYGTVFRLRDATRTLALRSVYRREMLNESYRPLLLTTRLHDGRKVEALTFVANRSQPGYRKLADHEIIRRLVNCRGERGANRDYALNTWQALTELGLCDHRLGQYIRALDPQAAQIAA
jgi:cation transport protein ChaC